MGKEKSFYAVRMGRVPGIYKQWHECEAQTRKFKNAVFKIRPRMPRPFSNGFGLNRFKRGRVVRSSPWLGWACRDTLRWTGPSLRESGKPCPTVPSLPKGEVDLGDVDSVSEQGGPTPR